MLNYGISNGHQVKETVDLISRGPPFVEGDVLLATVPFKPVSKPLLN